jgi:hypothetical protein
MKDKLLFKFLLVLILAFALGISQSQAQERVIIKLDGTMTPVLNENFGTHKYNQILTTTRDSTSFLKSTISKIDLLFKPEKNTMKN